MKASLACVDIPALPLQLLRRAHPEWRGAPLAVVESDHPRARIQWVDRNAHAQRVRVGLAYASALELARDLRAAAVSPSEIDAGTAEMLECLFSLTPRVEPEPDHPGVFWLDPSGLSSLFGTLHDWATAVRAQIFERGLRAQVVVGFHRLPSWAIARGRRGIHVLSSQEQEAHLACRVPLAKLGVPPGWTGVDPHTRMKRWTELRDGMRALGVLTVGDFVALPRGEITVRFGASAGTLHALFAGALEPPMQPLEISGPIEIEAELDPPDDGHRLLFCVKGALHALMVELRRRALAVASLRVTMTLERGLTQEERVDPARPTRDALSLLELVRLRLAQIRLEAPCERVRLTAEAARLDGAQLVLFEGRRHDPDAARRGIARLRAAFGDEAVTRARLHAEWLPERSFSYVSADEVRPPKVQAETETGTLCRRLYPRPVPLSNTRGGRPVLDPPVIGWLGPYRIQSGWWSGEVARDYFYAEQADGSVLWLFRDRRHKRWYLHGRVD